MSEPRIPNLYDLMCTLLIEFHEHSVLRVPDLITSLLALSGDMNTDSLEMGKIGNDGDPNIVSSLPLTFDSCAASCKIGQSNVLHFITLINKQYKEELSRISKVEAEICSEIVRMLRLQSQLRPVTITEVNMLSLSTRMKFDRVRATLRKRYTEWLEGEVTAALQDRPLGPFPDHCSRASTTEIVARSGAGASSGPSGSMDSRSWTGDEDDNMLCDKFGGERSKHRHSGCHADSLECRGSGPGWDAGDASAAAAEASHWLI